MIMYRRDEYEVTQSYYATSFVTLKRKEENICIQARPHMHRRFSTVNVACLRRNSHELVLTHAGLGGDRGSDKPAATACTCGRISTRPRRGVFLCAANRRRAFILCWAIGQIGLRPCCWCACMYLLHQKTPLRIDDSCVLQCVRCWFARPLP